MYAFVMMVGHEETFASYARRQVVEVVRLVARQMETTQLFVVADGVDGDLLAGSTQQRKQLVADGRHAEHVDVLRRDLVDDTRGERVNSVLTATAHQHVTAHYVSRNLTPVSYTHLTLPTKRIV